MPEIGENAHCDRDELSEAEAKPESSTEDGEGEVARYFLIFFQSGFRADPLGELNRATVGFVQQRLNKVICTSRERTEIDVWLESPGGDANAAYKLFLELRSWCRKIRTVIPDYAKSAATLLAIGTDEVYMAPAAELGPLDAQIEHPDRENVVISALDVAGALEFLGKYAVDYITSPRAVSRFLTLRSCLVRLFLRSSQDSSRCF